MTNSQCQWVTEVIPSEVRGWMGKIRRRTGDNYLTNFVTPSSKSVRGRWRWKERGRDRSVEDNRVYWVVLFNKTLARNWEEMRKGRGRWC